MTKRRSAVFRHFNELTSPPPPPFPPPRWLRLQGEEQEAGEGGEAALVEDALLGPQGDGELVALLQYQRHAVGGAAVAPPGVVDGKHVGAVLQQRRIQGARAAHAAGQTDVVETLARCGEDPWEGADHRLATRVHKLAGFSGIFTSLEYFFLW